MPGLALAKPTRKASRYAAQVQNHKYAIFPAPVMGLDVSAPFTEQDPRTGTVLENFIVRRLGSELRGGYKRHNSNLGGIGSESGVATMMAYQPPRGPGSAAASKLFAACQNGNIYDVTSISNEATTLGVSKAVPGQTEPGFFSFINFATANTNYLCAVSAGGGYFTYDAAGGWIDRTAAVTGVTGGAITFDFIMAWKNKLWFIQENSTVAYFLPTGSIVGAASLFDFGPLLVHGGELRSMASWTLDAGDGVDDKLIIAGAQGDILIYGGTDPTTAATFGLIGRWFVGPPPKGRRFMTNYGGDMAILSETGLTFISQVTQALGLVDPEGPSQDTEARRFNEVISQYVRDNRDLNGFAMCFVPSLEALILSTPDPHNITTFGFQFVYSTIPQGFSTFINVPMMAMDVFDGDLFIGTPFGIVARAFANDSDGELSDGTIGNTVVGSLQTAFVAPPDDRASLKRPLLIMPMVQSSDTPSMSAKVNTEWSGASIAGSPSFNPNTTSTWDNGKWDTAIWAGVAATFFLWIGATGLGAYFALRLQLIGKRGTTFTSWKLIYEPGGIM